MSDDSFNAKSWVKRHLELERKLERLRCLGILNLSTSELLLIAGEMTTQELRTVQAILKYMKNRIKNE